MPNLIDILESMNEYKIWVWLIMLLNLDLRYWDTSYWQRLIWKS